ncbi:hypothetical protein CEXT_68981 [Caerostris extrusa]|uniref:Uncharacterized protein n=1 Tax=Caerostris extrusa TaxID=172846 RepID=A0AAV4TGW9_CAEEX|nr:hypothetical protein CEXT_68981 [Caerostris extrusa]
MWTGECLFKSCVLFNPCWSHTLDNSERRFAVESAVATSPYTVLTVIDRFTSTVTLNALLRYVVPKSHDGSMSLGGYTLANTKSVTFLSYQ